MLKYELKKLDTRIILSNKNEKYFLKNIVL